MMKNRKTEFARNTSETRRSLTYAYTLRHISCKMKNITNTRRSFSFKMWPSVVDCERRKFLCKYIFVYG